MNLGPTTIDQEQLAAAEQALPRKFFVRRGHIRAAFGLTEEEMTALVPEVFRPVYLPPHRRGKRNVRTSRAVFVRTQVVAVLRSWSSAA